MLGVGGWEDEVSFEARRIRDRLCQLRPTTIEAINHAIVAEGQTLVTGADTSVRADSFVVETNIHYPTESTLIGDGLRKIIPLCVDLAYELGQEGWRQSRHLLRRVKEHVREIAQISGSKSPKVKAGLPRAYERLLDRASSIIERAKSLQKLGETRKSSPLSMGLSLQLKNWIELTERVCDTARRRVLLGEQVPNDEKLFSLFETHTQLYRRGKAGHPNQFGRLVVVFEDGAGFISHYHLANAGVKFHQLRRRHPGVESAIGALQSGNGMKRCRDEGELGFERYLGLALLGRNIHTLGKLLLAQEHPKSGAARSRRQVA